MAVGVVDEEGLQAELVAELEDLRPKMGLATLREWGWQHQQLLHDADN